MAATRCDALAYLNDRIIQGGLCTRCGACAGICPAEKISFRDPLGACLPAIDDSVDCGDCGGLCRDVCPGESVDFAALNRAVMGGVPADMLLGHAESWHVAWASDPAVRAGGASGGAITAMALHLLESGAVQGVVCLIDDPAAPLLPRAVIATDRDTLMLSQQSKYSLAPLLTVLREIEVFPGRVAIVALPDQVHALRKLERIGHPATAKIAVILGSYCGAIQHFTAVSAFLRKHGIRDLDEVSKVEYRAGAWPGRLRVTLRNGTALELDKFYANYMTLFYSVERSLLCVDLTNELSDIAFGDAWAPRYEARHEGFSLIAVRTARGAEVFGDCVRAGVIAAEETDRDDARAMHAHGLYNKKIAVWSRIQLRRWMGKAAPEYGYTAVRTRKQRAVGLGIALVFCLGRTRLARGVVQILPLEWTGRMFLFVRTRWRNATRPKRRSQVADYTVRWTESQWEKTNG
ncbi:MAG: Coenzyme F420 hydrogenase/dehydrogenase, beta subunit C-terminal domain [Candidatus Hydrogenedentes bacterium]|nr:Coenzyme F420 hydrogenase/dehydrogenase, beta subunit C-terminal domain [Candidatus Hydrogenedentota bacterium]